MKKPIQQVLLGAIALAATVTTSQAAITLTALNTPVSYSWTDADGNAGNGNTVPGRGDWLAYSERLDGTVAGPGAAEGTIVSQAALNSAVNAVAHGSNLGDGMASTTSGGDAGTDWLSDNSTGRINFTNFNFQFALGSVAAPDNSSFSFLQARLRNSTGAPIQFMQLSFDLATHSPAASSVGPAAGVSIYSSPLDAGSAGSFSFITAVDTTSQISLGQSQNISMLVDFGAPINSGDEMFIRWAVDNVSGEDVQYTIDNTSFTAVPEPSTGLLAASAAAALGFIRRRRK